MVEGGTHPKIFSIAAKDGFADRLVATLARQYADDDFGLARLTLMLPSSRAMRSVSNAFIRQFGQQGRSGILMPRMVAIGDLELDESLGPLLDPMGADHISPAVDPTLRWLRLTQIFAEVYAKGPEETPDMAILLRLAREQAQIMDRLMIEEISVESLWEGDALNLLEDQAEHWKQSFAQFYTVHQVWQTELTAMDRIDAADRRNHLFRHFAQNWRENPPKFSVVAAGITSASPALARLLKVIAQLPQGAVVLPDLDLALPDAVWEELGNAGARKKSGAGKAALDDGVNAGAHIAQNGGANDGAISGANSGGASSGAKSGANTGANTGASSGTNAGQGESARDKISGPFGERDAMAHPQYHLKLLLNRMGVARDEVQDWALLNDDPQDPVSGDPGGQVQAQQDLAGRSGRSDLNELGDLGELNNSGGPDEVMGSEGLGELADRGGLGEVKDQVNGKSAANHRAISNLFLPTQASKKWASLPAEERNFSGISILESATPEDEAQAAALMLRRFVDQPGKRAALVTPDRALARKVASHLRRWNIEAYDSAGTALPQTVAGRLLLLLADVVAQNFAPVPVMALLQHPLVHRDEERQDWLRSIRQFEIKLRGPRPKPGLEPLRGIAEKAGQSEWWAALEAVLQPLVNSSEAQSFAAMLEQCVCVAGNLCGNGCWEREDGRALSQCVEDLMIHLRASDLQLHPQDLTQALRLAMEPVTVRPPYSGHPRIAIYGLLEARMSRADLIICAGLNEGVWPAKPSAEALLPPALLRQLGVPNGEFRIGLSAHDLSGLLHAKQVVLSRAHRDQEGPTIPSRFLLRMKALLGEDGDGGAAEDAHQETDVLQLAQLIDYSAQAPSYEQPKPMPSPEQRLVPIAVTALDRLRGDPYQFYAQSILRLRALDPLDSPPSPAWQGIIAHEILQKWHLEKAGDARKLREIASQTLKEHNAHPLMEGLWLPRLLKGLEWVESTIEAEDQRRVAVVEEKGEMVVDGVRIHGRADRIDQYEDGTTAVIDYKTGAAPSAKRVKEGFALQLGLIGMMAERGGFKGLKAELKNEGSGLATAGLAQGTPVSFEYWSLAKSKSETGFGKISSPVKMGRNKSKLNPEDFLPLTEKFLKEAIGNWIKGEEPFTARLNPEIPGYDDYDQLMRLDEWQARIDEEDHEERPLDVARGPSGGVRGHSDVARGQGGE